LDVIPSWLSFLPGSRATLLPGAQFYPFFTTGVDNGACKWQEGGNFIPGTTNHFGGSSKAEYGPLLKSVFPSAGFKPIFRYDNFNSGDTPNPCPAS
jgi:hypothetical protein